MVSGTILEERSSAMPNIVVDGPVIKDIEKKRVLVREMTDSAVKAFGLPEQAIVVIIKEKSPENVGVAGKLVSDRE